MSSVVNHETLDIKLNPTKQRTSNGFTPIHQNLFDFSLFVTFNHSIVVLCCVYYLV